MKTTRDQMRRNKKKIPKKQHQRQNQGNEIQKNKTNTCTIEMSKWQKIPKVEKNTLNDNGFRLNN